jgi:hypothetical protein
MSQFQNALLELEKNIKTIEEIKKENKNYNIN